MAWYDRNGRDLPWRRTRDPWAIWVSEVMLQQTRVETVRQRFSAFMQRYPTARAFAAAGDDELLAAWRGLGYYRRARLLREGALAVVREHDGRVPADPSLLAALPGIGRYTAGAIASIAFSHPALAVDGNVERVATRHCGIANDPKRGAGAAAVRITVRDWLDCARAGDFNQALMELGAVVCTPRSPRCLQCPVADDCIARRSGRQLQLPALAPRRAPVIVVARALLVHAGGLVLGIRVPAGAINGGQMDLPGPGPLVGCADASALAAALAGALATRLEVGPPLVMVSHAITHHRIRLTAHAGTHAGQVRAPLVWAAPDDPEVPWTTIARKVFSAAGPAIVRQGERIPHQRT